MSQAKNLHEAAREYRAAAEAARESDSDEALVAVLMADGVLKASALAECYECGGPNPNCQCWNDE